MTPTPFIHTHITKPISVEPGLCTRQQSRLLANPSQRVRRPFSTFFAIILAFTQLSQLAHAETNAHGKNIPTPDSIEPFFETYCYSCHDADTAKADLNLEDLTLPFFSLLAD